MKKKYLVMVVAIAAALAAGGCGGNKTAKNVSATTVEETTEETTEEETTEEETTEEETTEEETTKAALAKVSSELSEDIYSYQVQLNEEVYQIPMSYADFTARGWVYDGDETTMVGSMAYAVSEVFRRDGLIVYVDIVNFSNDAKQAKECMVGGLNVDSYYLKDIDMKVVMPKGIQIGISTTEDIKSAYGEPTDSRTNYMEYSTDIYNSVEFKIDSENILSAVDIQNFVVPTDSESETKEVSNNVPEIVTKYQAPNGMSDNFADFTVEYAGVVYTLPAPVSVFEANGWTVQESRSDLTAGGRNTGWVTLMKDNQSLRTMVKNYSDLETPISNCFVTSVESSGRVKVPLTISKGITTGMSQADLESALSGETFKKETQDSFIRYTVTPTSSALNGYGISVGEGVVITIEAEYSPKYDEYVK